MKQKLDLFEGPVSVGSFSLHLKMETSILQNIMF